MDFLKSQHGESKLSSESQITSPESQWVEQGEKEPRKEDRKRYIVIGGGIAAAFAAFFLLTDDSGGSLLSFLDFGNSEESEQVAVETTATPAPQVTTDVEDDLDEEDETLVEEAAEDSDEFEYKTVSLSGEGQRERAWQALKRIEEWRTAGGNDVIIMRQYLGHRKVWVRLAAFELAIKQKKLDENEVQSVAYDLRKDYHRDQMRRWLKRVHARDTQTWSTMTTLLGL
jgi:hypothetical protein